MSVTLLQQHHADQPFTADTLELHLPRVLDDCEEAHYGGLVREQGRGASYKRLATIGHIAGMDVGARSGGYRVAESIPLSDTHAGHILSKLKRWAA